MMRPEGYSETRAEILARWNRKQQARNLFTNISEEQIHRATMRELAKRRRETQEARS